MEDLCSIIVGWVGLLPRRLKTVRTSGGAVTGLLKVCRGTLSSSTSDSLVGSSLASVPKKASIMLSSLLSAVSIALDAFSSATTCLSDSNVGLAISVK